MRRPKQREPRGATAAFGRAAPWTRTWLGGAALLGSVASCSSPPAPSANVLLDGLFGEWTTASTLIDDPPDTPDAAVDVLSVQALDDEHWLYLALDVGNEVSLQALPGTLHLMVDADGDAGTGVEQHGMRGVDLVVDLSHAPSPLVQDRRAGFGARVAGEGDAMRGVARDPLGLVAAPTWAAPRFELRLSRLGSDQAPSLGGRSRIKLVYVEDGAVLEETEVGTYAFQTAVADMGSGSAGAVDTGSRLRRTPGSVRVTAWNVAVASFTRRPDEFGQVLAALAPDVVLLDELPGDVTQAQLDSFFASGALGDLGAWTVTVSESGGVQRAAVAARGFATVPAVTSVRYPDGALDALRAGADEPWLDHLDSERERGVSAAGAWIEIDGYRTLFAAVDLQSGGWPGSPRDRLRAVQAAVVRARLDAARGSEPALVVIGGDLNLVGSRAPLFALVRGLDVDGSDLVDVEAERVGERTLTTWRNTEDLFAPGRLDFLLIPDAAVTVTNSFVFATEDLDDVTLEQLGLERDLMETLSDHLVVVADLVLGGATAAPPRTATTTSDSSE